MSLKHAVTDPTRTTSTTGKIYLAVCIVLIGLNLRTLFSSFAAILPEITTASGISPLLVSALTTVPVLLLGVCAPAAPPLARRFGPERVIFGSMVLLTLGLAARGLGPGGALLAGTIACGAAIAIVNVLLPGLVKRDFQHRLGLLSGLYTGAICAAAALGAGFTYPIYQATGSWQFGLFFWALPAAAVVLIFAPLALRRRTAGRALDVAGPSIWRSHTAWQVTIFMVLQAMMSFSVFAWLVPILRERGIDGGTAGLMVAVSILLQVAGSFVVPAIAVRCYDQRLINAGIALLTGAGFALSIFGPLSAIWLWTAMLGLGQGSMTALALTMIVLRTRDGHTAARLSGMMQCVGYGLGSSGTLLVGQLHATTGEFTAAGIMFLVIGLLGAVFGYRAGRNRIVSA